jgi:hypothetical protein
MQLAQKRGVERETRIAKQSRSLIGAFGGQCLFTRGKHDEFLAKGVNVVDFFHQTARDSSQATEFMIVFCYGTAATVVVRLPHGPS